MARAPASLEPEAELRAPNPFWGNQEVSSDAWLTPSGEPWLTPSGDEWLTPSG